MDIVINEFSGFHSDVVESSLLGCDFASLYELFLMFQGKQEDFYCSSWPL